MVRFRVRVRFRFKVKGMVMVRFMVRFKVKVRFRVKVRFMTINPLDFPGNPVQFEAVNLKPDAGHNKDGIPYYKLTMYFRNFEEWEVFQKASLKGASFAVVMNRVDLVSPQRFEVEDAHEEHPRGPTGLRCREAVGLMKEKDFADYVRFVNMEFNGNDTPKEFVQIMCDIKSRREFDEGPDADKKYALFCGIKKKYREWQRSK